MKIFYLKHRPTNLTLGEIRATDTETVAFYAQIEPASLTKEELLEKLDMSEATYDALQEDMYDLARKVSGEQPLRKLIQFYVNDIYFKEVLL